MPEDELLQLLRQALPPVPAFIGEAGRRAWEWRDPDASLAALVLDSRASVGMRSGPSHQHVLLYRVGPVEISLLVRRSTSNLDSVTISVEGLQTELSGTVEVDSSIDGRIERIAAVALDDDIPVRVSLAPGELIRVTIVTDNKRFATPWLRADSEEETDDDRADEADGDEADGDEATGTPATGRGRPG